jgi:hypothetical protein
LPKTPNLSLSLSLSLYIYIYIYSLGNLLFLSLICFYTLPHPLGCFHLFSFLLLLLLSSTPFVANQPQHSHLLGIFFASTLYCVSWALFISFLLLRMQFNPLTFVAHQPQHPNMRHKCLFCVFLYLPLPFFISCYWHFDILY